jgi:predicted MPP superfamily phosphohydrolase
MDNKKVLTDSGIEVIWVDYSNAKSQATYESVLDDLMPSPDRFSAFMFHEPKRVESTASRGYDLQLYGHTHGWQIFPWNLIAKSVYGSFAYGLTLLEKTNTRVYTTFGAGLWGPRMRLGSENEVVLFTVEPK